MVRSPDAWAVAVRRPDGQIHTERHGLPVRPRLPGVRGALALVDALRVGARAIAVALSVSTGTEVTATQVRATLVPVFAGFVSVFVAAPSVVLSVAAVGDPAGDVVEGVGRYVMFVAYLLVVSRSPAAVRLFGYHGAEHQVIAVFERTGTLPSMDEARATSPIHTRCGTSFLSLLMIVCGAGFAFLPRGPWLVGAGWRILALPLAAGVAYEVMRAAARVRFVAPVVWPGRALQRVTTRPPSDDMLQVARAALARLLDPA